MQSSVDHPGLQSPPIRIEKQRSFPHVVPETEDGIACLLAEEFKPRFRYDVDRGRWFVLDRGIWVPDELNLHYQHAREFLRRVADEFRTRGPKNWVPPFLGSKRGIDSVVGLVKAEAGLRVLSTDWDTHPFVVGTPKGVFDLDTGMVRPPSGIEMVSRRLAVAPDTNDLCPVFRRFLEEVTGGEGELKRYLLRWLGYMLTGSVAEQSLLFIHGTGQNGKSVLVDLMVHLLGDYAGVAPMSFFMDRGFSEHGCETAVLNGARLVTATETSTRQVWNESKLKQLTGGDKVSARFMRQDPFEFHPKFKLLFAGNHKPRLQDSGPSMARRLHLLHFRFVPRQVDPGLREKLRAESPGILAMIIEEGYREWRQIGLSPPQSVVESSQEYLAEQDSVGQALDGLFEFAQGDTAHDDKAWFVPTKTIRAVLLSALEATGSSPGFVPESTISTALEARGCRRSRSPIAVGGGGSKQRGWFGLRHQVVWPSYERLDIPGSLVMPRQDDAA